MYIYIYTHTQSHHMMFWILLQWDGYKPTHMTWAIEPLRWSLRDGRHYAPGTNICQSFRLYDDVTKYDRIYVQVVLHFTLLSIYMYSSYTVNMHCIYDLSIHMYIYIYIHTYTLYMYKYFYLYIQYTVYQMLFDKCLCDYDSS